MTFRTVELPADVFVVFDDECATYDAELVDITDIDKAEDKCVLHVNNLTPETAKLKVPYSKTDSDEIHMPTGVNLFLSRDNAVQLMGDQCVARIKKKLQNK